MMSLLSSRRRATELLPFRDERAVLVEDLDAHVSNGRRRRAAPENPSRCREGYGIPPAPIPILPKEPYEPAVFVNLEIPRRYPGSPSRLPRMASAMKMSPFRVTISCTVRSRRRRISGDPRARA